jgi:hypothetical protein
MLHIGRITKNTDLMDVTILLSRSWLTSCNLPTGVRYYRILQETSPTGLTKAAHNYLIRASALQAQVAQSVEQRTENTRNSLTLPP